MLERTDRVALFVDGFRPLPEDLLEDLLAFAETRGIELLSAPPSSAVLSGIGSDEEHTADAAMVIGGDGTILRGMHYYAPLDIPVIGLNSGRMGFLAGAEALDFEEVLDRLSSGDFEIDEKPMLTTEHAGEGPKLAVNDVCINRSLSGGMLHLSLFVDDQLAAAIPGDGGVVSTPMGSTAYALSANGPILDPDLPAILIAAICPHLITLRPLVVPSSSEIRLLVVDCRGHAAHIVVDGVPAATIGQDESMTVAVSERKARVIRLRSDGFFYNLLGRKFGWGRRGGI